MILTYNGADLSSYITKYGFVETPRIIEGWNKGVAMDGSDIPDVIAVKYDITLTLKPLTPAEVGVFWSLVGGLTSATYKSLTYTSANGNTRTIQARISSTGAAKVLETTERTYYNAIVITFSEK